MLTFPNAKLNLGLYVTARRPDGYHEVETVFLPLPWTDVLEVLPAPTGQAASDLTLTGRPIPGEVSTNLFLKAFELLKADFRDLPAAQMQLHKIVPIGAGLGGGSADAAFALRAIGEVFGLHLTTEQLENYARRLGADCAFFIENTPRLARGKGDIFEPIALSVSGTACVVVYPGLHISTPQAFAGIVPQAPAYPLREALAQPMSSWRATVSNDFEKSLAPTHPVLADIKQQLYAAGATYASLSGSGSAVYGLFKGVSEAPTLPWPAEYLVWRGVL
ncbi:4-(cytidine 5'-diphospho)-2-C-methyl-D-erythritol kinase [Hymenobacter sp. UV11]|uniref:4-(cytidine 5'-diphospho)-2-C-methyl-D-erythritol kinase n=1 Tax=Hymenobacter sp. UV11 TaxID=1849735 RepID=UPI00105D77D2|nr:4-(cytidine 5'-diphospho)-2-C-methyl-D-erythritol kinase [Hymenobacter sp. UV11]TDN37593.1 4-(cytidine 5'-diphospho)-2-C-methyl-D-erythritol kinase [Hymenobacter sp. UV11]TFZ68790.1 4-(cytidine 5'-diphospho)-2-C-methyl-D-erythritol kinase [Hymenobacter sp. UV11]